MVGLPLLAAGIGAAALHPAIAQVRAPMTDGEKATRGSIENELASLAVIERKLMIRMHVGRRSLPRAPKNHYRGHLRLFPSTSPGRFLRDEAACLRFRRILPDESTRRAESRDGPPFS